MLFNWREHREKTQLLIEQSRNLEKISYHDLDRRQEADRLREELEQATPKLFGGSFNFSADFVDRLKTFMVDVVGKLEQAVNQNEVLRKALAGMKSAKERAERELSQEEWKNQRLEIDNQNLRQENKELKGSKDLLEDIQEVITEKEVDSLNKRLEELRRSREVSRGWNEPRKSKGRSI